MSDKPAGADEQSLIVNQLIAEFMSRTNAGETLDAAQFIAEYPEHKAELQRHFANVDALEGLVQTDESGFAETILKPGDVAEGSVDDATAHTVVRGTADSETSVTRDHQHQNVGSKTNIEIPETFGRYAIQKVLGQGAMGAVYLAKDTQLDRDVALKIPKFGDGNGVDDEELLERFYREARASATIRSLNICPVYDVGEIDGQHYITMAFIEGRPLKDFTKSKKSHSEKQIITTIRKLALGLEEAHKIGVVHRDLKPANIMVDLKGEPVVMDFGLARRSASDDVQVTQSGAILGTPAYMAPEQVAGDQAAIDHRVDIYALGIIMYELITGEMPFKGNLMAILQQIALNNPKKPTELRKDIDPRLETICLKMMAGDQSKRYQSMTDVAADLQDVLRNPGKRQKKEQAKKSGPKPTSIPSAHEESNPALISVAQPKSYSDQLREKKSKPAKKSKSSKSSTKLPQTSPAAAKGNNNKKYLIAGGLGGLLLLLGIVFIVRLGKYEVQIKLDDPRITLSVDGEVLNIDNDGKVIKLSAGEHKLKLEKEGLTTHVEEFTVTKDGKTALRAVVLNNKKLDALLNDEKPSKQISVGGSPSPPGLDTASLNRTDTDRQFGLFFGQDGSHVDCGEIQINASEPFTAEFWCRPTILRSPTGSIGVEHQIAMDLGGIEVKISRIRNAPKSFWQFVIDGDRVSRIGTSGFGRKRFDKITANERVHIAAQWTGKDLEFYVNGIPTSEPLKKWGGAGSEVVPYVQSLFTSSTMLQLRLGSILDSNDVKSKHFDGEIDEFRLSTAARYTGNFQPTEKLENDDKTLVLYNFDEGAGDILKDSSGNGHDGKIIGAKWVKANEELQVSESMTESALSFDGIDDYVHADSVRTVAGETFNFELWMRCEGQFKDIAPDGVIHQFPASVGSALLTRRCGEDNLNKLYVTLKATDRQDQSLFATYYSLQSPVHEWIHVYIQIDEQSVGHLYVNGKQSNESRIFYHGVKNQDELTQALHDLWQEDYGLTLGAREFPDQENQFRNEFQGIIREFRMSSGERYSEDFTPEQRFSNDETTKVLYYFDEGAGDTLYDSSGNGHDGKIVGAKWVKTTSPTTSSPPPAIAPFDAAAAMAHQKAWADYLDLPVEKEVELPGGEKMTFMLIPPGEFMMGSSEDERAKFLAETETDPNPAFYDRILTEGPQHSTRITRAFYLGKFEVTQAQWQTVMGNNPSKDQHESAKPVEQVSWDDVQRFLAKLREETSTARHKFMLPTEAQWELACRAGTTTPWHSGNSEDELQRVAWVGTNSKGMIHQVGQLASNGFGLHDMHGNVFEWCSDWHAENSYTDAPVEDPKGVETGLERVCRGGTRWGSLAAARSAYRGKKPPSTAWDYVGFRLAMTIDVTKLETSQIPPAELHGSGDILKDSSVGAKIDGQAPIMATGPTIPLQSALEFNGKGRVRLPKTAWYEDDEFTFEAFVRPDVAYNEGDAQQFIVNQHYTSALSLASGRWVFSAHRGEDDNVMKLSRTDQLAAIGSWVHLAGVSRNGTIQLFVDGEPMEAEQFPENVKSKIGEGISLGDNFVGAIRQIKISKTAQYDKRFEPPQQFSNDANTVALYKFDEGTGDILKDSSGNGHDGKISGAKWVGVGVQSRSNGQSTPASLREMLTSSAYEWTEPENLGPGVNTPGEDRRPALSADGLTIIYESIRPPERDWKLYESSRNSPAEKFGSSKLVFDLFAKNPSLSRDGLTLVLSTDDLAVAERQSRDAPWNTPHTLGREINSVRREQYPVLSPDALKLVYAAHDLESKESTIYLCERESPDADWNPPKEVSQTELRGHDDFSPSKFTFSIDNRLVVHRYAEGKLLIGVRNEQLGWTEWEMPFPIKDGDAYLRILPDFSAAFFSSQRPGGHGSYDIWMTRCVRKGVVATGTSSVTTGLPGSAKAPPPAVAPFDARQAKAHQKAWADYLNLSVEEEITLPGDETMSFALVPPGTFWMGSTDEEIKQREREEEGKQTAENFFTESPRHRVTISKPFAISRFEVTRGEFRSFVEATGYVTDAERDGKGGGAPRDGKWTQSLDFLWNTEYGLKQTDDHPVVQVSWNDAVAYCEWLSTRHAATFYLPTEAQWEYACRAGTETPWHSGSNQGKLKEVAWFNSHGNGATHPVGELKPNAWGLHDMHGNVFEWCSDIFSTDYYANSTEVDPTGPEKGDLRVLRGGCWINNPNSATSTYRGDQPANGRLQMFGFRVAMVIAPAKQDMSQAPADVDRRSPDNLLSPDVK